MKKIAIVFSLLAANCLAVAVNIYVFFMGTRLIEKEALAQQFTESAAAYYNPYMQPTLLLYVLGSFLVGVSLLTAVGLRSSRVVNSLLAARYFPLIWAVGVALPVGLSIKGELATIFILFFFWVALAVGFKARHFGESLATKISVNPLYQKIYHFAPGAHLVLWGSISVLVYLVAPFSFGTPKIMNDFFRIPEMYSASPHSGLPNQTGDYVDSTTLRNQYHLISGLEYVDITNYQYWKSNPACLPVPQNRADLAEFVNNYMTVKARPSAGDFGSNRAAANQPAFIHYSEDRICLIPGRGSLGGATWASLRDSLLNMDLGLRPGQFDKPPSMGQSSSHDKVAYMAATQMKDDYIAIQRGQLKHHFYYLFPSYEHLMGKPLNKIVGQYGLGYVLFLSGAGHMAQLLGFEVTYGGALKFLGTFFFLGAAVYLGFLGLILKNIRLVALGALILALNYLLRDPDVVLVSPGIVELRYIFDLPALFFLYRWADPQFARCRRQSLGWLLFFLGISLLNNFEFGLFLASAFFGALLVYRLFEGNKKPGWLFFGVGAAAVSLGYWVNSIPQAGIGSTFLQGFFSLPIEFMTLGVLLILFVAYILMFFHMRACNSRLAYPFLAACFYAQTLMCYYVWCGFDGHIYALYARHALPGLFYFSFVFEKIKNQVTQSLFFSLAAAALIWVGLQHFDYNRKFVQSYERVFQHYKIYHWDKFATNIDSTMNPAFFEPAVGLIMEYLPERKDLYIISQYDFWLTYLANKYSGLPHFDLTGNLAKPGDIDQIVAAIRKERPEYLFVDSDINVPYELSLLRPSNNYYEAMGRWSILALNNLRKIYDQVIDDYTLVEAGQMISVYRLNTKGDGHKPQAFK